MKKYFLSLLISLSVSTVASSQAYCVETDIDNTLSDCMNTGENQTTYGMIGCIDAAYAEWDAELNKYYKLLMEVLTTEEQVKLKTSQRNWIAFRDAENEFVGLYSTNLEGSMYLVSLNEHAMQLVRIRASELKAYYEEILDVRN